MCASAVPKNWGGWLPSFGFVGCTKVENMLIHLESRRHRQPCLCACSSAFPAFQPEFLPPCPIRVGALQKMPSARGFALLPGAALHESTSDAAISQARGEGVVPYLTGKARCVLWVAGGALSRWVTAALHTQRQPIGASGSLSMKPVLQYFPT